MIHAKYATLMQTDQEDIELSQELARLLESFVGPLLVVLDQYLDKRLLRTLVQCCALCEIHCSTPNNRSTIRGGTKCFPTPEYGKKERERQEKLGK